METAIIYTRTANKQQDNASIKEQELICKNFLEAKGLKLVGDFCDNGVSGAKPMRSRSAGDQLISAADSGKFNVLVLESLDRLSRNSLELLDLINHFKSLDIRIVSISDGYDSSAIHPPISMLPRATLKWKEWVLKASIELEVKQFNSTSIVDNQ